MLHVWGKQALDITQYFSFRKLFGKNQALDVALEYVTFLLRERGLGFESRPEEAVSGLRVRILFHGSFLANFPIHYSLIILRLDAKQSELLTDSLNK